MRQCIDLLLRLGILLMVIIALGACSVFSAFDTPPTTSEDEMVVQTDPQTLNRWIDLSLLPEPTHVTWIQQAQGSQSSRLPGPTDYFVMAVLEFQTPAEEVLSTLELTSRADVYIEDALIGDWLPQAIRDRFVRTPEGYLRFDGSTYMPGSLLLPPLSYGYILVADHYLLVYGATT